MKLSGNLGRFIVLAMLVAVGLAKPTAAAEHIVRVISDYDNLRMYFKPKLLTIAPGDKVTWINEADEFHNMLTYPDGYPKGAKSFVSVNLTKTGQTWSHVFTVPGTYEYHCLPHLPMGMHGMVIAGAPSKEHEFHQPTKQEVAVYRNRLLEFFDEDEYKFKDRKERLSSR
jgi:plastocyanin